MWAFGVGSAEDSMILPRGLSLTFRRMPRLGVHGLTVRVRTRLGVEIGVRMIHK